MKIAGVWCQTIEIHGREAPTDVADRDVPIRYKVVKSSDIRGDDGAMRQ
jgi:hypothetical protein